MKTTVVNVNRGESCDVNIMRPGPWSNPFTVGKQRSKAMALNLFRQHLLNHPMLVEAARRVLKGRRLGCCCKPERCHGDIWVEVLDVP